MYNAEKYIDDCLNSVLNQDIDVNEYEIIVANDGSKDRSVEIVEEYVKKNSNIILLNQQNRGTGAAKNTAFAQAKGKYIYFLDSDDYIASNTLGYLIQVLEENELEILGFKSVLTHSSKLRESKDFGLKIKTNIKVENGIEFLAEHNYKAEIWWYIIKRDFFLGSEIIFYDRKFVQDAYVTPQIFVKAKKVCFLPIDVHRYRHNDDSITHVKSVEHIRKHMDDLIFAIHKLDELKHKIQHEGCLKRLKNRQQSYVFFFLIRFIKTDMRFKELKVIIQKLKAIGAYPLNEFVGIDYNGFKYSILVYIFNHPFLLYPFLFFIRVLRRSLLYLRSN